jgi:hypothetical protein
MAVDSASSGVTYTVKELLAKIEGKLDGVIITIGQKADKHDVDHLSGRVEKLEEASTNFEAQQQTAKQVALTLAEKEEADRTWWERQRGKVGWVGGGLIVVASFHSSFPHLF